MRIKCLFGVVLCLAVFFIPSIKTLECNIVNNNNKEICAYDHTETENQVASCLVPGELNAKLFCYRDTTDARCGEQGCIYADVELSTASAFRLSIYESINEIAYELSVSEESENSEKKRKLRANNTKNVQNTLLNEKPIKINVTLTNSTMNNDVKIARLAIKKVSYTLNYHITANLLQLAEQTPRTEILMNKLTCNIMVEEPEEEIINFHLEIIIVVFLVIFYIIVIIIAWKCKHEDDEHDEHKPKAEVEVNKKTGIQVMHVDDAVNDTKEAKSVMFEELPEERRYSLNKRRATGYVRETKIAIPEGIEKTLRRKSVQFNSDLVSVRKMSSRTHDTHDDDDEDDNNEDSDYDEYKTEAIKKMALNMRRKSMQIGPEFFKELKGKPAKQTISPMEDAALKAIANKKRRASAAYAVQKARSLNVSDSD